MCGKSGKSEYPVKTTQRPEVTDKLYHVVLITHRQTHN